MMSFQGGCCHQQLSRCKNMAESKEEEQRQQNQNWSERVEDLVIAGDTDGAISMLETLVSKLDFETNPNAASPSEVAVDHLQLASALTELAKLYASKDFSLKSDQLLSRASLLKQRALRSSYPSTGAENVKGDFGEIKVSKSNDDFPSGDEAVAVGSSADGLLEQSLKPLDDVSPLNDNGYPDDDWEAIADRTPSELLSPESLPSVSTISPEGTKVKISHRRGRGTFSYKKCELYSDHIADTSSVDNIEDEDRCQSKEQIAEPRHSTYSTRHVLVLADFSPSTRTIDLERLFEGFKDRGVAIRWVNDTTAIAVFRAPSIALEAKSNVRCPFTVRILEDDDILMSSIPTKDLEPPRQRPQTSARTAQRLIAQGMGLKLPATAFGSRELKSQEEARKNRIVTRQKLRDDAWGDDDDDEAK